MMLIIVLLIMAFLVFMRWPLVTLALVGIVIYIACNNHPEYQERATTYLHQQGIT